MLLALLALVAAVERPPPHRTLLRAAHLFDARKGVLVSPGAVLVEDTRIVKVGADASAPDRTEGRASPATGGSGRLEQTIETIDLGDSTLLPGLMDAHEHL